MCGARLPGVAHDAGDGYLDRGLQVGVEQHDVGGLPPSASETRWTVGAASRDTCTPTLVEPVNAIMSTSGGC